MYDGTFVPLDGGTPKTEAELKQFYEKIPIPHFKIYWQTEAGSTEKKYKNSSGGFTISASTATAALAAAVKQSSAQPLISAGLYYTVETEYKAEYVIKQEDAVSLPENGFDAAATDKVINPYVKQVGSTAQDRAVFDIVFGAVGSADSDKAITNVGYILFYGNNYIDLEDYIEQKEDIDDVDSYLKGIVGDAVVGAHNLPPNPIPPNTELYPGSGKCRVAKYQAITSGTPATHL